MLKPLFGIRRYLKTMFRRPERLSTARGLALGLTILALALAFSGACANDAPVAPTPTPAVTALPPAPTRAIPTALPPATVALPTPTPPPAAIAPAAKPLPTAALPAAAPPAVALPTITPAADFVPFVQLAAGVYVQCGLRAEGRLFCRGQDNQRVPKELTAARFRQVAVGQGYACGLLLEGRIACWGDNAYGKGAPPPGQFTAVAAGRHYTCALDPAGQVQCWGRDAAGLAKPPTGLAFTAIAIGANHSCGLTPAGALHCWGQNRRGQANNHSGPFQSLTLGDRNTCALRPEGTAWCQGDNAAGQSRPPPGAFTQIAAGSEYACGIRPGGQLECWGGGFGADLGEPSGEFTAVSGREDFFCALAAGYPQCWRYQPDSPQPVAEPAEIAYIAASGEKLRQPVELLPWPGGGLAIVEREGLILLCDYRAEVYCELSGNPPLLDLTDRVDSAAAESGLLSAALDPDFDRHPFLYGYYTTRTNPRKVRLSRFPVVGDRADPTMELVILELAMPDDYHFGGAIRFGPDAMLYLGLGDNRAAAEAQNPANLRGKIIRIAVRGATPEQPYQVPADNPLRARPEIWAYGLQNPWRMAFDAAGRLWVGDVGSAGAQAAEEVSIATAGANLGWPLFEGPLCYGDKAQCAELVDYAPPAFTYGRAEGCAIIWGGEYRGAALPRLAGSYLFSDYCSNRLWALTPDGAGGWSRRLVATPAAVPNIIAFGTDAAGEMYVLAADRQLLKLEPAFGDGGGKTGGG